jgi:16S rRNA (guanine(966)-N(2))-methyltransferase RsmD
MARARQRNQVRIIGGQWRSRLLRFPDAEQLRPTPDRVRETLFNWLGQDLTGLTCLDLFAGSGVLGLEAASRGAQLVVMVERDPIAFKALRENANLLQASGVELVRTDALEFLTSDARVYDVVFLDPPYALSDREPLLTRVRQRLAPGAMVYSEWPGPANVGAGWEVVRDDRAGAVHYRLLRALPSEESGISRDL